MTETPYICDKCGHAASGDMCLNCGHGRPIISPTLDTGIYRMPVDGSSSSGPSRVMFLVYLGLYVLIPLLSIVIYFLARG